MAKIVDRLKAKNINLKLDDKAREFLVEKGYDPQYGARPMRRAVERYLENLLVQLISKDAVAHPRALDALNYLRLGRQGLL